MITIKNLKIEKPNQPWQVKIDRSSILGNPFVMKGNSQQERESVCAQYKDYFYTQIKSNIEFNDEVHKLITIYGMWNRLELFCWCAPKQCHGETIAQYIEDYKQKSKELCDEITQDLSNYVTERRLP